MINTKQISKVFCLWVSIIYIVCFLGVAIYPPIRQLFMRFALHMEIAATSDYISFGYLISGLIIWNIITLLAVWLFAAISNGLLKK